MNLIFIICAALSAFLIITGVLCLVIKPRKARLSKTHTISETFLKQKSSDSNKSQEVTKQPIALEQIEKACLFAPALMASTQIELLSDAQRKEQALLLIHSAETLNTLTEGLKKMNHLKAEDKRKELQSELESCVDAFDAELMLVYSREKFDSLYPAFFNSLLQKASDLNSLELRLCALVALDKNSKEIALITRRSVRTIETAIYRIRKKLSIPTDDKTTDFLKLYLK